MLSPSLNQGGLTNALERSVKHLAVGAARAVDILAPAVSLSEVQ
jgi:hypothetical protein